MHMQMQMQHPPLQPPHAAVHGGDDRDLDSPPPLDYALDPADSPRLPQARGVPERYQRQVGGQAMEGVEQRGSDSQSSRRQEPSTSSGNVRIRRLEEASDRERKESKIEEKSEEEIQPRPGEETEWLRRHMQAERC